MISLIVPFLISEEEKVVFTTNLFFRVAFCHFRQLLLVEGFQYSDINEEK